MPLKPSTVLLDADSISAFPVSLGTIKTQLRIDHAEFDSLIEEVHLPAAFAWAEGITKRFIVNRTVRWGITRFPTGKDQTIVLPGGKVSAVTSIGYYPPDGALTTLTGPSSSSPEGTDYREDLRSDRQAFVMPADSSDWPDTDDDVPVPVLVTYNAGWAEDDVPKDIIASCIRYIGAALEDDEPIHNGLLPWAINRHA